MLYQNRGGSMSEPQKLVYRKLPIDVACSATDDCTCSFCQSCKFLIDLANQLLSVAVENDLKEHYNYLAMNLDGLFVAASEKLGEQKCIQ
jgi:hypothetical protein